MRDSLVRPPAPAMEPHQAGQDQRQLEAQAAAACLLLVLPRLVDALRIRSGCGVAQRRQATVEVDHPGVGILPRIVVDAVLALGLLAGGVRVRQPGVAAREGRVLDCVDEVVAIDAVVADEQTDLREIRRKRRQVRAVWDSHLLGFLSWVAPRLLPALLIFAFRREMLGHVLDR